MLIYYVLQLYIVFDGRAEVKSKEIAWLCWHQPVTFELQFTDSFCPLRMTKQK